MRLKIGHSLSPKNSKYLVGRMLSMRAWVRLAAMLSWTAFLAINRGPAEAQCPAETERQTLMQMFGLADHHDVSHLLAIQNQVENSHDRALIDNYRVALYMSDEGRFKDQFVTGFPTDTQGFLSFGCGMAWSNGGRQLFPYRALAKLALGGNRVAIRKALLVETDGFIAEETTDNATLIAAKFPHTSLDQLESTTEAQRFRVVCYNLDDLYRRAEFDQFLATKPASPSETALLKDLNAISLRCSRPSLQKSPYRGMTR